MQLCARIKFKQCGSDAAQSRKRKAKMRPGLANPATVLQPSSSFFSVVTNQSRIFGAASGLLSEALRRQPGKSFSRRKRLPVSRPTSMAAAGCKCREEVCNGFNRIERQANWLRGWHARARSVSTVDKAYFVSRCRSEAWRTRAVSELTKDQNKDHPAAGGFGSVNLIP
jgi:hypothetical protein